MTTNAMSGEYISFLFLFRGGAAAMTKGGKKEQLAALSSLAACSPFYTKLLQLLAFVMYNIVPHHQIMHSFSYKHNTIITNIPGIRTCSALQQHRIICFGNH